MTQLNCQGRYEVDADTLAEIKKKFWAEWVSETEAGQIIRQVWEQEKYLLDPHTAVAWKAAATYEMKTQDKVPMVVLSTASPFKFADSVLPAIGDVEAATKNEPLDLLVRMAEKTGWRIPAGLSELSSKALRHKQICPVERMSEAVGSFIDNVSSVR